MFESFLKSIEDPKKRLLGPTIWSLKFSGYILPEIWYMRILRFSIHLTVIIFAVLQVVEAFSLLDELSLFFNNMKIAILTFTCFFKIVYFICYQKSWIQIFDYITAADQFERDNADFRRQNIIDGYTNYCRKVTYFYWLLMFFTHLAAVAAALYLALSTLANPRDREAFFNGTLPFTPIFLSWAPFDKDHHPWCWLQAVWHYLLCANGALYIAVHDATIVVVMVFFGGKLDLLRERCKHMFGEDGKGMQEREFEDNLKLLHNMHVDLIKHFRLLNSIISPVMFVYVILCSVMLCSSLYRLTCESDIFQILMLGQYLIFGITQLFLVCKPSNDCFVKSRDVSMGPYESEWWNVDATARQQRAVVLLGGQLGHLVQFTAGPFTDLNLPTFVAILKGAYSYYALLRD